MKGVKMTLDTKVQPNSFYINWQRTKTGWRNIDGYDKSVDAIVLNVGERTSMDISVVIPNPVAGDVYTVSFDAWGSTENNQITTHLIPLEQKDIIACASGGKKLSDNGHVDWFNLSEKSKRYFTTYRLVEKANSVCIRARTGTTYIRNIKLEKSPYPTDYED